MSRKRRVIILGGGLGGLSAAHELSKTAALRATYDVTLYQMGWRLGGKAASGRGPNGRIEEHGLHLFFGFYDNAFALVRALYDELDGPGNLPSWRAAFVPQHSLDLWHRHAGQLRRWSVRFPQNDEQPGGRYPDHTLADLLERALSFSLSLAARALGLPPRPAATIGEQLAAVDLSALAPLLTRLWAQLERHAASSPGSPGSPGASAQTDELSRALTRIARTLARRLGHLADRSYAVYRAFVALDWVLTVLRGALEDGLACARGWERIDDLDYRDWLAKHGADRRTLASALVRAYYSAVLAVPEDRQLPVAAGTALRTQLRMFLTYRGAFLNKVRAGLGDSVIAPAYKVLRRRGVDIRLFHRVVDVVPEGRHIARVELLRQARAPADYAPLIRVAGLDVWPNAPLWDQLEGGRAAWPSAAPFEHGLGVPPAQRERGDAVTLTHGRDFDDVVFAIPHAAAPRSAPSLLVHSPAWRAMVTGVRDIATQSFQLWLRDRPRALGWTGDAPFSTTYRPPVDTWADVSFALEHEDWPDDDRPQGLLYFTGFFDDAQVPDDAAAVSRARERAATTMARYVDEALPSLFPRAGAPGRRLLHRPRGSSRDPLAAQFSTANIEPWERYVLAAPGTNHLRLAADACGYDNLTVAGDWTANGIYSGCAEGAVVGGMLAARALGCAVSIQGDQTW